MSVDKPLRVPKPRLVEIKRSLRRVADRGGASSAEARATLREIERLQEQVRELNAQLRAATNAPPLGGAPPGNSPSHGDGSHAAAQASEGRPSSSGTQSERYDSGKVEEKAATTEEEASRTIVTAELETESEAVKEGEKVAAKEGEKAAAKGGRLYARIAAKIGLELLEALVPDPLDALELMVNFAGAFTEAKAAIRERNLQNGFAIGWAAYLVVPRWEWAKRFAFTTVSRDVATEVLGAAGVAENAFNEGLVRGFMYGEKHTAAQSDLLRQRAFNAVLRSKGHTPGRYDGDDAYTFGPDDVYAFAGAMWPAAVAVLKEADRRRAARLEQERRTKHALASVPSWPR